MIAPTTAVTALLLYFGRQHAAAFFGYFGVNFTVLDLTPTDFLVRSADGLFVPIAIAALCALVGLWAHRLVVYRLPGDDRRSILRVVAPAAATTGAVLVAVAVATVLTGTRPVRQVPEAGGLSLSIGVLLLVYGVHLARSVWTRDEDATTAQAPGIGVAEWGAVFVLVTVGLFWAVTSYAGGVGQGRALDLLERMAGWPDAVVFSERSLSLDVPGVVEVPCAVAGESEVAYRFRYDGLKLVQQAGDHYLLLPAEWTPRSGAAVLLPRTDDVRLEFALAGTERQPVC
ncbi:hypothetical protein [Geodermatophilus maliterrae]|uniref:DUF5671 domain-containing protein n=1 Tax=Geodermatophilus maliterrae TaxID=3162531 RepID=A0ABV3XLN4_9ACTN